MNLSESDIFSVLKAHYKTRRVFIDCLPCDLLPHSDRYPYAVVANTDTSDKGGRHWVAIYATSPTFAEYFDTSGRPPSGLIKEYLSKFSNVLTSDTPVQSPFTDVCGAYCIYFIMQRCSGKSFREITQGLTRMPEADLTVCTFYYRMLS